MLFKWYKDVMQCKVEFFTIFVTYHTEFLLVMKPIWQFFITILSSTLPTTFTCNFSLGQELIIPLQNHALSVGTKGCQKVVTPTSCPLTFFFYGNNHYISEILEYSQSYSIGCNNSA